MSRRPDQRPASVLELVRELQAVETELGVPQTPIEVAMDDWALATVSDLEDRTRIRGAGGAVSQRPNRRRRRSAASYTGVGTILKQTAGANPGSSSSAPRQSRGMQALAWSLVAAAVLVIALGATATIVLIRANSGDIPKVTDIAARSTSSSVEFSWDDPGIKSSDTYQITTNDGRSSIQRTASYVVDATQGQQVCITVTVNRQGKIGPPSSEKCVDFGQ